MIYDRDRGAELVATELADVRLPRFIEQLPYIGDERLRYAEIPEEDTACCPRPIGPS
jgi:hypothetical protein